MIDINILKLLSEVGSNISNGISDAYTRKTMVNPTADTPVSKTQLIQGRNPSLQPSDSYMPMAKPTTSVDNYSQPQTPTGTMQQYTAPTSMPQQAPSKNTASWEFPINDKPQVPEQYRETIVKNVEGKDIPNLGPIVASVLGQETGGYGYGFYDPKLGKINTDWKEAQRQNIRGGSGEVGMAQIIPKWHWKASGYPDEETYAQALYDPNFAIQEATRILGHAYDVYGDWTKALGTWNKAPSYPNEILGRIGLNKDTNI